MDGCGKTPVLFTSKLTGKSANFVHRRVITEQLDSSNASGVEGLIEHFRSVKQLWRFIYYREFRISTFVFFNGNLG